MTSGLSPTGRPYEKVMSARFIDQLYTPATTSGDQGAL